MSDFTDLFEAVEKKAEWLSDVCLDGCPESYIEDIITEFQARYDEAKKRDEP